MEKKINPDISQGLLWDFAVSLNLFSFSGLTMLTYLYSNAIKMLKTNKKWVRLSEEPWTIMYIHNVKFLQRIWNPWELFETFCSFRDYFLVLQVCEKWAECFSWENVNLHDQENITREMVFVLLPYTWFGCYTFVLCTFKTCPPLPSFAVRISWCLAFTAMINRAHPGPPWQKKCRI